jgi:hypothetical protein
MNGQQAEELLNFREYLPPRVSRVPLAKVTKSSSGGYQENAVIKPGCSRMSGGHPLRFDVVVREKVLVRDLQKVI